MTDTNNRDQLRSAQTLYQTSTVDALYGGDLDGTLTLAQIAEFGVDTGFGTIDALDGDLVYLDGVGYTGRYDGKTYQLPNSTKISFAFFANFGPNLPSLQLNSLDDLAAIETALDVHIKAQTKSLNYIYLIKIQGDFLYLERRAVEKQGKPYISEGQNQRNRRFFEHGNITGTVLGLRLPGFADGLNEPGWHFHFISASKTAAGHATKLAVQEATAEFTVLTDWHIILPETAEYRGMEDL